MTYPTPASAPKLRLHCPADILAAVPYLLGFHPTDSMVALALRGTKVVFHVRVDLLPAGAAPSDVSHVAQHLADIFDTQEASGVLGVGYGDPPRVTALLLATAKAMRARGLDVVELLRAADGRYWSYECHDPACCPPEGVPYDVTTSVVAAQATVAGCTALPDRDALAETFAPPTGADLIAAQAATRRAEARLHDTERIETERIETERDQPGTPGTPPEQEDPAMPDDHTDDTDDVGRPAPGRHALLSATERYATGGRLTDDEVAWLTVLLRDDIRLRDAAWDRIDTDGTPEVHAALWTDVVRRCDPDAVVSPAVLLGYCWWRLGDGTRAGMAIDRALAVDPDCSAALLIAQLLWRGVPPSTVDALARLSSGELAPDQAAFDLLPSSKPRSARPRSARPHRRRKAARRLC